MPGAGQVVVVDTPGVANPQLQVASVGTAESSMHEYAPQSQLAPLAGHVSVAEQYQNHPGVCVVGGQATSAIGEAL